MSVATPFNSLGAGNGFPFCFRKVDVSAMAYWVSLGGNQKGGAVIEANFGFEEAMQLFWNLEKLTYNFHSYSEHDSSEAFWNYNGATVYPPRERVCSDVYYIGEGVSHNFIEYLHPWYYEPSSTGFPVVRMYDGDIDDETKFVGYGFSNNDDYTFSNLGGTSIVYALAGEYYRVELALNSFISTAQAAPYTETEDDYTVLDGFHFVCSIRGYVNGGTGNDMDAAECYVSYTPTGGTEPYLIIDLKGHASGKFFNFHTYP